MQYTIRSVPPIVDKALRDRARKSGKSINEVAVEALAKGVGVIPNSIFNDLDWFIGNKSLDASFNDALNWLDNLPQDIR